jgi:hypothetical protein
VKSKWLNTPAQNLAMRPWMAKVWSRVAGELWAARSERCKEFQRMSELVGRCGNSEYDDVRNDTRRFICRQRGCPSCLTQRVAITKRAIIVANFMNIPLDSLWAVRLSLPGGRVPPAGLRATKTLLDYLVRRFTQSALWKKTFSMWAGCVHPEWMVKSEKHGPAGFWVHLHLVCEAVKAPSTEKVQRLCEAFGNIVELPRGQDVGDVVDIHVVRKSLDCYAEYMTDVENLLPGYGEDQRGQLIVRRMPTDAIVAFMDTTKGMRRLVAHGLDPAKTQAALADPKDFLDLPKGFREWRR